MSTEEKKFYPFSNDLVPDEYDGFLLLSKEQKYKFPDAKDNKKEVFVDSLLFTDAMTPEQNNGGNFECHTKSGNVNDEMSLCHVFTIIDKDEEIEGDWKEKCPTSLDSLRPFSFKDRSLVNKKYKDSFPKVFLVAMNWKNSNKEKKIENISDVYLRFKNNGDFSGYLYQIFSWRKLQGGDVFCNKDLLNIKKLN